MSTLFQDRELSGMMLGRQLLLLTNPRRVMKSFLNNSKCIILQRERLFTSGKHSRQMPVFPGVNVPASSPNVRLRNAQKNCEKPRATSQTLWASISMLNVKVHDSTIRKRQVWLVWKGFSRKTLFSNKNIAAWLRFVKLCLKKTTRFTEQWPLDRRKQGGDV